MIGGGAELQNHSHAKRGIGEVLREFG